MSTRSAERDRLAAEIASLAEDVVRAAEEALAAAEGPTARDVAETRLTEIYAESDAALEAVAPAIEAREQDLRRQANDVCRAMAPSWARSRGWPGGAISGIVGERVGGAPSDERQHFTGIEAALGGAAALVRVIAAAW